MKRRFQNGLFVKREEGDYEESNPGTGNTSTQIIEMLWAEVRDLWTFLSSFCFL